jgi:hypothetical protein
VVEGMRRGDGQRGGVIYTSYFTHQFGVEIGEPVFYTWPSITLSPEIAAHKFQLWDSPELLELLHSSYSQPHKLWRYEFGQGYYWDISKTHHPGPRPSGRMARWPVHQDPTEAHREGISFASSHLPISPILPEYYQPHQSIHQPPINTQVYIWSRLDELEKLPLYSPRRFADEEKGMSTLLTIIVISDALAVV